MEKELDNIRDGVVEWKSALVTPTILSYLSQKKGGGDGGSEDEEGESERIEKKKERVIEIRKGKFGKYAIVDGVNYSLAKLGNRPIENISIKEVEEIILEKDGKREREKANKK